MDAIFTAAEVSTLSSNVQTLLVGFVGIGILYVGYRFLKKTFSAA